jgi:ParB family chromosome partitioning protein
MGAAGAPALPRDEFLGERGSIDSASLKLGPVPTKKKQGLVGDIEALSDAIKAYPWTTLANLKGDAEVMRTIAHTEKLLKDLERALKG